MNVGRTIRSYIWWTHERGSFHYDVMVTLILLFIFVTPHFVNFKDKPAEHTPHPIGVSVQPDGSNGFIYRIDAAAVKATNDAERRAALMQIIEPIAGEVKLLRYEPVQDVKGNTVAWRVWVRRGIGG